MIATLTYFVIIDKKLMESESKNRLLDEDLARLRAENRQLKNIANNCTQALEDVEPKYMEVMNESISILPQPEKMKIGF